MKTNKQILDAAAKKYPLSNERFDTDFNYKQKRSQDGFIDGAHWMQNTNQSWKGFEHRGKNMSKMEVFKVLEYAELKGYKHTRDIPDNEIDLIIKNHLKPTEMNPKIKEEAEQIYTFYDDLLATKMTIDINVTNDQIDEFVKSCGRFLCNTIIKHFDSIRPITDDDTLTIKHWIAVREEIETI